VIVIVFIALCHFIFLKQHRIRRFVIMLVLVDWARASQSSPAQLFEALFILFLLHLAIAHGLQIFSPLPAGHARAPRVKPRRQGAVGELGTALPPPSGPPSG
jgi:hypothetical protein